MGGKTVKVITDMKYGNTYFYPANEQAQLFVSLTPTQTLLPRHLKIIKELGFEVEDITPSRLPV